MTAPFTPPARLLLGPGPSNVAPETLAATARPTIGHLDPAFQAMMEETKSLLRWAFRTENPATLPLSAPASFAMEAALANLLEPGETAIVAVNGVFGTRMADIVERCGATLVRVDAEWGRPVDPNAVADAIQAHPNAKLLAFVHAETSTGARSDAEILCRLARDAGLLSVIDTVTGLGGIPVDVDAWGADIAYSGAQKCLATPPGLAPFTVSERALAAVEARKTKVQTWFGDLSLIMGYWTGAAGGARAYHHTAPVNALYGLHEALRRLEAEGLDAAHARHAAAHARLAEGLDRLGLSFVVAPEHRLPQLNAVYAPEDVDEAALRRRLLDDHDIEIGAGLGAFAGKVLRIGLMGENARPEIVDRLLGALEETLAAERATRAA